MVVFNHYICFKCASLYPDPIPRMTSEPWLYTLPQIPLPHWGNPPWHLAIATWIWDRNPVAVLRRNVFQRDMTKVTLETSFLNRWFSQEPETPMWTSTQISCRHPAFWQLQFFLFQFQFLLIFKILISEMYVIIVLQCLAIYLCPLLYARLILSHGSCRRASVRLLLRCHLSSQAIKPKHFTLSPEEKHAGGGSHLVTKQKAEAGNELTTSEENKP